jgi:hypothetical protein
VQLIYKLGFYQLACGLRLKKSSIIRLAINQRGSHSSMYNTFTSKAILVDKYKAQTPASTTERTMQKQAHTSRPDRCS